MKETLKAKLYTVEGKQFDVVVAPEREFSASSLTDNTIQTFTLADLTGVVLIQGSKIIAIQTKER